MKKLLALIALSTLLTGCATQAPTKVRLATHDSFVISDEQIAQFEEASGFELEILRLGDTGSLTNQLVLTKGAPVADAFFGIDNTFESVAIANQIVDGELTPIDYSDVCFNIDNSFFANSGITPPESWRDLTNPEFAGLTVITDPSLSSPGMAFLATTVAALSTGDKFNDYWSGLAKNQVLVAGSWEDAYFTNFSRYGGEYPIVLSYASSPSAEINEDGTAGTSALLDECFRQVEYAGVIAGSINPIGAQKIVEFLTSADFQQTIPESMYVYPINQSVSLPEQWLKYALPARTTLGEDLNFELDRQTWVENWRAAIGE